MSSACTHCGRDLPPAFPGAVVACAACGQSTAIERISVAASSSPYRDAGSAAPPEADVRCPYCSHACPPLVRICPSCDVRLENVRCAGCYSLQAPGAFTCARCKRSLELEPLLDPTDAPCPRCRHPLEVASEAAGERDDRVRECPRCGGIFVPREALAELLARAEVHGAISVVQRGTTPDAVTYPPCPLCHVPMNRVNFGRVSGVIVDVCKAHGTWFDAGELTRVLAFVAGGGRAKTRAREAREEQERAAAAKAQAAIAMNPVAGAMFRPQDRRAEDIARDWANLLDALFDG